MWCCCSRTALTMTFQTARSPCTPSGGGSASILHARLAHLFEAGIGDAQADPHSLTRRSRRTPTPLRAIAHVVSCLVGQLVGVLPRDTATRVWSPVERSANAGRCSCTSDWSSVAILMHCKPSFRRKANNAPLTLVADGPWYTNTRRLAHHHKFLGAVARCRECNPHVSMCKDLLLVSKLLENAQNPSHSPSEALRNRFMKQAASRLDLSLSCD